MRKVLATITLLALALTAVGAFAADKPVMTVPRTKSGSPAKVTGPLVYDNHDLAKWKAQNKLTAALNAKLTAEKNLRKPGFKNGTIDTIPYFNSWFITGSRNSVYTYSMVGQNPTAGGTTSINTEIIPLISSLEVGGVPVYVFDPSGDLVPPADQDTDANLFVQSPLYDATTTYPGPPPDTGQVVDTAQRVEFRKVRTADWHTPMNYVFGPFIWLQHLEYNNGDWVCYNGEAPPCTSFPVFNLSTVSTNFEFIVHSPLELASTTNNIVPIIVTDYLTAFSGGCCILGFHTAEPGVFDPNGILVWTWGTYIPHNPDQGFTNPFVGGFGYDSMVLSHEISELYNDPFVNTSVSAWVDGSVSFAQGNLETGDTIEAMNAADVIYNVNLNTTTGPYQYNLQNVATLEWFTRNPFTGGIYSWPNEHTLGQSPHPKNCNIFLTCWSYGEGSAGFFFGPPY